MGGKRYPAVKQRVLCRRGDGWGVFGRLHGVRSHLRFLSRWSRRGEVCRLQISCREGVTCLPHLLATPNRPVQP
jgi:hypothetical protein